MTAPLQRTDSLPPGFSSTLQLAVPPASGPALPVRGRLAAALDRYCQRFALSEQETRLLTCAVAGLSDKCAALALGCSRHTIGTYWRRIFEKTGARPQKQVLIHLLHTTLNASSVS